MSLIDKVLYFSIRVDNTIFEDKIKNQSFTSQFSAIKLTQIFQRLNFPKNEKKNPTYFFVYFCVILIELGSISRFRRKFNFLFNKKN